ncbi:hypothetical protein BGW39_006701 [Mortierella sp. 14UC]|nr:hypothetical protein BGW39_006701 [Mortierella sp. 14UC]
MTTATTVDLSKAPSYKTLPTKVVFTLRDYRLYALSIGIHSSNLHFLYENDPCLSAFPTYPLVLAFKRDNHGVSIYDDAGSDAIPGIPPLRPQHCGPCTVTGVCDKGKGMAIERTAQLVDPKGVARPYATMMGSAFVKGRSGWGGPRGPATAGVKKLESLDPPKDKAPGHVFEDSTHPDQAILYHLSGDYNPLHIDSEIAPMAELECSIPHGLCTYGHSAQAIPKTFGNSDPRAFRSITGRFSAPVLLGNTLVTKMWNVPFSSSSPEDKSQTRIFFQTFAKERDFLVINSGCVVLQNLSTPTQSKL